MTDFQITEEYMSRSLHMNKLPAALHKITPDNYDDFAANNYILGSERRARDKMYSFKQSTTFTLNFFRLLEKKIIYRTPHLLRL